MDFRALFAGLPSAYLVMSPDLVIVEVNDAYLRLLGRTREEILGRPVFEAFPPAPQSLDEHGRNLLRLSFERALSSGRRDVMPVQLYPVRDRVTGRMAARYWSSVSAPVLDGDGVPRLLVQRVDDVTGYVRDRAGVVGEGTAEDRSRLRTVEAELFARMEQLEVAQEAERAATAALRVSEQRARAVLDTAVDGIITIDGAGRVETFNRAAESMFGYRAEEVVGRNVSMLMPHPYRTEHDGYLERYRRTGERRIIGIGREVEGRRRDGSTFPLELAVSEVGTGRDLYTGVVRDITERKRLEEELTRQALFDPLTGLANRRLLMERLELAVARRRRRPGSLALIVVDLDRFKQVNDTFGHAAGDELLLRTADRLRGLVRPEDLVGRLGGDEFVVLCEDLADEADAGPLAHRIAEELNRPVPLLGEEIFVAASVGVISDSGRRTAAELLADADAAMYRAKAEGGARSRTWDELTRPPAGHHLTLGGELHRALERGEMRPRYQPVVDLGSGAVQAAEALLRWQHPRRGELSPGAFLDLAHDLGLITDLDTWMLATACIDAVEWRRHAGREVSVWVNLSSRTLADHRLLDTLGAVLDRSGLDPAHLTLEITESALMQNAPATAVTLERLKELGVQLAIDDFGTGYSSLAYLQEFPVHALKVDRSFVDRLDKVPAEAEASAAIVQAVVNVALALGLRTIAEGIETPGQLEAVTGLGCDLGQGYFLGRPASRHHLATAMRTGVTLPTDL